MLVKLNLQSMAHGYWPLILLFLTIDSIARGAPFDVRGRVVDKEGRPVAEALVDHFWYVDESGQMRPTRTVKTNNEGWFNLECEFYGRKVAILAMIPDRKLGGITTVGVEDVDQPVQIELSPLVSVHGHFTCNETGKAPIGETTGVLISLLPDRIKVFNFRSQNALFSFQLPIGSYEFLGGGGNDYLLEKRTINLGHPLDVDLGPIDLKLTPIARYYGKEPPAWNVTDARGVKKDVQLSEFKGRWVLIEFWGVWCGPCVNGSLPSLIDFYEDHAAHRDQFEILAFHDQRVKSLQELDEALTAIIRVNWRGRRLPFPILLDDSGTTVKNYGIESFPTALVIDPNGHLVKFPEATNAEDYLASKLPPIPPSLQIARALDRDLNLGVSDFTSLSDQIRFLNRVGRIKIELDAEELKKVGVEESASVPISLSAKLSLRAWLNLSLESFGLTYVAAGHGLRIVQRTAANGDLSQPSERQKTENARIEEALQQAVSFDFRDEALKRVVAILGEKTRESFVLDPSARRGRSLNPETKLTGKCENERLDDALSRMLAPLGLTYKVREEAVVLTVIP